MYSLMIDVVKEMVYIELSGYLAYEEIVKYVNDLKKLTLQFESKIYSMLVISNRLDPISQYNLPHLQKAVELALSWAGDIAVVNGNRTITLFQMKRIEAEARKITNSDTKIMRFKTRNDALRYLYRA